MFLTSICRVSSEFDVDVIELCVMLIFCDFAPVV